MLKTILYFLFFMMLSSTTHAFTLETGLAASNLSLVSKSDADVTVGEIKTDARLLPSLSLKTNEYYIQNSNWGYFFEWGLWKFTVDKQGVPIPVDIGTRIDGHYSYITPTLYYRFGDTDRKSDGWKTSIGIGLGLGYLRLQGTMLNNLETVPTLNQVNDSSFGASTGFYMEVEKGNWFSRISNFGPVIQTEQFKYEFFNLSWILLGYRFNIDL